MRVCVSVCVYACACLCVCYAAVVSFRLLFIDSTQLPSQPNADDDDDAAAAMVYQCDLEARVTDEDMRALAEEFGFVSVEKTSAKDNTNLEETLL